MQKTIVIWDWDGTLVDSIATARMALQDLAAKYGLPEIQDKDILNVMSIHKGTFWTDNFGPHFDAAFHYFLERFEHHNAQKDLEIYEGALEAMRWLKSHGIPQMVISNKPQYLLDEECDRLELHSYFVRVFGTDVMDEDKKPNLTFAHKALQDLFYDSLVMIGDGEADMYFARNLQALALYVHNPAVEGVPYDKHFQHHDELLPFLQQHFCGGHK